jgi:hypothetical protein
MTSKEIECCCADEVQVPDKQVPVTVMVKIPTALPPVMTKEVTVLPPAASD